MTCNDCLMFTHCRYDLERNGDTCESFIDKNNVVNVVRCADCLYSKKTSIEGILSCMVWDKYIAPTHYCSHGE